MDLEIKGFVETSLIDWDGKIVSTIFLPNCNFRCLFCHNAGLIENPQSFAAIPLPRIENFLLEHQDFIDGICLTGGEPCLHKERGLFEFLRRIRGIGFAVKLDTNGADPRCLQELIEQRLVNYLAMDIKAPFDERYSRLAGVEVDLAKIRQSVELIKLSGLPYEFRTTVVPTLLSRADLAELAKYLTGADKFILQQFVPANAWAERLRGLNPYPRSELEAMLKTAQEFVPQTTLRGA